MGPTVPSKYNEFWAAAEPVIQLKLARLRRAERLVQLRKLNGFKLIPNRIWNIIYRLVVEPNRIFPKVEYKKFTHPITVFQFRIWWEK